MGDQLEILGSTREDRATDVIDRGTDAHRRPLGTISEDRAAHGPNRLNRFRPPRPRRRLQPSVASDLPLERRVRIQFRPGRFRINGWLEMGTGLEPLLTAHIPGTEVPVEIRFPPPPRVQADVRRFTTEFSQAAIQADVPIETRFPGFTVNFSFRGLEVVTSGSVRRPSTPAHVEARVGTISFNFNGVMNSSNATELATIAPTLAQHVRQQSLRIRCNVEVVLTPQDMRRWSGYTRALTRFESAAAELNRLENSISRNQRLLAHLRFREENTRRFLSRARTDRARENLQRNLTRHRNERRRTQETLRQLRRNRRLQIESVRAASDGVEQTARRLPRMLRRARSMAMARMAARLGRTALLRIIPFVGAALVIQDIYECLLYSVALVRGQASFGLLHPGADRPVENPSDNPDAPIPTEPAAGGDGGQETTAGTDSPADRTAGQPGVSNGVPDGSGLPTGQEVGDAMERARRDIAAVRVRRFQQSRFGQFMQRARGYDAYFEPDAEVRHPRSGMSIRGSLALRHNGRLAGSYPVTITVRQLREEPTEIQGVVRLRISTVSTQPFLGVDGNGQVVGRIPARQNVTIRATRGRARSVPAS